jgi:hypothetical protein
MSCGGKKSRQRLGHHDAVRADLLQGGGVVGDE